MVNKKELDLPFSEINIKEKENDHNLPLLIKFCQFNFKKKILITRPGQQSVGICRVRIQSLLGGRG